MWYFVEAKANNPTFPNIYHSFPITCIVEKAKEPHRKIPPKIIKTIFNYWVFFCKEVFHEKSIKRKEKTTQNDRFASCMILGTSLRLRVRVYRA